ncbi:MAG: 50S ribosomal protein L29 [Deltaproteobacteria bacterium CG1_02_45_11]|nr:MAG: 50S ribosomal protein L29 [Deltaproteobacteria bacterium CG1_02_45_11]
MKASAIRELSLDEMQRKVDELKEELFNLRFQHGAGQLENPQKMKQTKRAIARANTVIRELTKNNTDK